MRFLWFLRLKVDWLFRWRRGRWRQAKRRQLCKMVTKRINTHVRTYVRTYAHDTPDRPPAHQIQCMPFVWKNMKMNFPKMYLLYLCSHAFAYISVVIILCQSNKHTSQWWTNKRKKREETLYNALTADVCGACMLVGMCLCRNTYFCVSDNVQDLSRRFAVESSWFDNERRRKIKMKTLCIWQQHKQKQKKKKQK